MLNLCLVIFMPKKKIKLCLNANLTNPEIKKSLSKKYKVRLADQRAKDIEIIKWANKMDYHIVTRNTRHYLGLFRTLPQIKIGVIGINTPQLHEILPRLNWLLSQQISNHEVLYRKFYEIDLQGFSAVNKENNLVIPKTFWPN